MNSVTILNAGLNQIKTCQSLDIASEITADTYVRLITSLLDSVGEERKADLRDKIGSAIIEDSVTEYSGTLPCKRRRIDIKSSITERFNLGKSPDKKMFDFEKSPSINGSTFAQTPSIVDITPVDHGARRMSWSRLVF